MECGVPDLGFGVVDSRVSGLAFGVWGCRNSGFSCYKLGIWGWGLRVVEIQGIGFRV